MGIGLSGMVSGLDTDAIVKALMGTQREKSTKIENKITTNEWKIEKWKDLNSKIYSLYTGSLYKMKRQGNYLTKRTSSSNENIVTATASSKATLGTHTVKVISTASAQYVTGKALEKEGLTEKSTLKEAGVAVDTVINIKCGDKSKRLEVKEDTTIEEFLTACQKTGLNANFDTTRNRFYISSKQSGKENAFSITTEQFKNDADNDGVADGLGVKQQLNELLDYSELSEENQKKIDDALEVIRGAADGTLEDVLEQLKLDEKDREYSTDQLNVLSAYNTIQTIAKDSAASKLALNEVQEKIRTMIKDGGKNPVYGISYSEISYKNLESSATTAATAEWTQQLFEKTYQSVAVDENGNPLKDENGEDVMVSDFAKFGDKVTYKYIQELTSKVSKIENNANLGLTLTAEEAEIWKIYTDEANQGAKKTQFDEDIKSMITNKDTNGYKDLYDKEFARLVELDVKYYYKNSTQAQADFEAIKKQYQTPVDEKQRPQGMKDTEWDTYKDKWQGRYEKLYGDPDATDAAAKLGELGKITEALKDYEGMTIAKNVNGLEALGLRDMVFKADGSIKNEVIGTAPDDSDITEFSDFGMSFVAAADGQVEVDGAVYEADSNTITVNGLTLDLKMADKNTVVNVTVSKDTDKVYDMVKDFVKEYNELLDELNEAYNADSARDYKPLTEEQKEAMSEKEIEKWENKIKDSLLRRDNTLNSLISSMRTCLSGSVEVDGKKYALSSFGICTGNYSEKGKLHIYGDSDDSVGAMYDDKLRAAIEENPDAVMEVLQGLSENLYNTISDKMKSTSLSSALTVYNDKKMKNEITTYKKELSALEKRLAQMEERYYKQFTAMEKALSQMNSSANSLASMLGTPTQ